MNADQILEGIRQVQELVQTTDIVQKPTTTTTTSEGGPRGGLSAPTKRSTAVMPAADSMTIPQPNSTGNTEQKSDSVQSWPGLDLNGDGVLEPEEYDRAVQQAYLEMVDGNSPEAIQPTNAIHPSNATHSSNDAVPTSGVVPSAEIIPSTAVSPSAAAVAGLEKTVSSDNLSGRSPIDTDTGEWFRHHPMSQSGAPTTGAAADWFRGQPAEEPKLMNQVAVNDARQLESEAYDRAVQEAYTEMAGLLGPTKVAPPGRVGMASGEAPTETGGLRGQAAEASLIVGRIVQVPKPVVRGVHEWTIPRSPSLPNEDQVPQVPEVPVTEAQPVQGD